MSGWTDPIKQALDARTSPVAVFCRDDDAGWEDDHLNRFVAAFSPYRIPLDLAVIPAELNDRRAAWLLETRAAYPSRLGLHQHGWSHANHEAEGRKCEFGRARTPVQLSDDVARGRERLTRHLGDAWDPVFTPPWNRCVPELGPILATAGFAVLSRDASAASMHVAGLLECPAHIDWSAKPHGRPQTREQRAIRCAEALASRPVVGMLFHHAVMDRENLSDVGHLLEVLTSHPTVRCVPLMGAASLCHSPGAEGERAAVEAQSC